MTGIVNTPKLTKKRDFYFDNVKFFLILIVVATHTFSPVIGESWGLERLFYFIYTFHMPAFIIVSGYFMKYIKNLNKYVIKYSKIYLFIQTLYFLVFKFVLKAEIDLTYSDPYYTYWFMFCLIIWYVIFPQVKDLKGILSIAVAAGIAVGYDENFGLFMSLSRVVVFFPYFLIGHYLKKEHIITVKESKWKYIIWVACIVIAYILLKYDIIARPLLQGKSSYAVVGYDMWYAGLYRLALYGVGALFSFGFFLLIPDGEKMYSKLGAQTLYVYLIHGIILKVLRNIGFYEVFNGMELVLIGVLFGLMLTVLVQVVRSKVNPS
ncbi:fucose 4-O-acetylase-like acetyltransferase [Alkalibaculum bacchi]|uniref:Fucose 4-O-acetylase-like acetyltransferase n=1 Tax=Alkalibaculum bacchi TaxID=645887 RepID=A0A366HX25_9FIRM|nr:acyltransferase family protein [Alkalibaculum bacchi]RBP58066.1 fucose 4-O-acetylase-like acetyltransferase [Alkalibaculum bacchi]